MRPGSGRPSRRRRSRSRPPGSSGSSSLRGARWRCSLAHRRTSSSVMPRRASQWPVTRGQVRSNHASGSSTTSLRPAHLKGKSRLNVNVLGSIFVLVDCELGSLTCFVTTWKYVNCRVTFTATATPPGSPAGSGFTPARSGPETLWMAANRIVSFSPAKLKRLGGGTVRAFSCASHSPIGFLSPSNRSGTSRRQRRRPSSPRGPPASPPRGAARARSSGHGRGCRPPSGPRRPSRASPRSHRRAPCVRDRPVPRPIGDPRSAASASRLRPGGRQAPDRFLEPVDFRAELGCLGPGGEDEVEDRGGDGQQREVDQARVLEPVARVFERTHDRPPGPIPKGRRKAPPPDTLTRPSGVTRGQLAKASSIKFQRIARRGRR